MLSLIGAFLLGGFSVQPAFGTAAELPTLGGATLSYLGAGAAGLGAVTNFHGGGVLNRLFLGASAVFLGVVDPGPATYLSGQMVVD